MRDLAHLHLIDIPGDKEGNGDEKRWGGSFSGDRGQDLEVGRRLPVGDTAEGVMKPFVPSLEIELDASPASQSRLSRS